MSDYIITVNSTVDTTREWLAERGVPYIPLKYTIDGQTYSDMEGLSSKEFFDKLRECLLLPRSIRTKHVRRWSHI